MSEYRAIWKRGIIVKRIYKMKKTLSMKLFVDEFGEKLSKHMKKRLLELGPRCVLTRKEKSYILDIKHVEHGKYQCNTQAPDGNELNHKEYAFGQFIIHEGELYFSQSCIENCDIMQAPIVNAVYDALNSTVITLEEDITAKKVDDENIDFIVDSILKVCPEISEEHLAIISRY